MFALGTVEGKYLLRGSSDAEPAKFFPLSLLLVLDGVKTSLARANLDLI
jgi:hypothetical protein